MVPLGYRFRATGSLITRRRNSDIEQRDFGYDARGRISAVAAKVQDRLSFRSADLRVAAMRGAMAL